MAQYDDLPIQRITVVSIVSIAVTVVTILAVQVLYYGMQNYVNTGKSALGRYTESDEVLASQRASISRYGVNDSDARFVIPIEQAMRDIVSKASGKNESAAEKTEGT
ncbi:MAG TPA: hypothetical protein DDZ51_08940 [Planctomycetaceae bacterium]|nr:hypothetical protein [Planctomycetaceae bacterium]